MKKLLLEDYGTQCSSQIYILDDNIQKNMIYFDYKTKSTINIVKEDLQYEACIIFEDKSQTILFLYPSKNFHELVEHNKNNCIEIYNYNNTKHVAKEDSPYVGFYHTVTSPDEKVDFTFPIDKDQAVVTFKDNKYFFKIVNYKNDEIGEKIADVWVDNNGYKKSDSIFSAKINGGEIMASLFLKKGRYDCIIMDNCPTLYRYIDSDNICYKYEIQYNKFGVPNKIINIDNPEEVLSREETWFVSNNGKHITSVYPLLFDAFNYNYIDKPMKYWCCTTIVNYNKYIEIRRDIYEIEPNLLGKLKKELSRDLDKCIIEHVEY